MIEDPHGFSHVRGVVRLAQGPYDSHTSIWASVDGVAKAANLSVYSCGDLTKGCESTCGVFQPAVTASGFPGHGKPYPKKAAGDLGSMVGGSLEIQADIDLSGSYSAIGRSMVVTGEDGHRIGCCTIGLAAGPEAEAKPQTSYVKDTQPVHTYQPGSEYHEPAK